MSENEGETVTAWITKHALSWGIYIVEGTWISKESRAGIFWRSRNSIETAYGNDWHLTPEAALARAEEMRSNRIKDLKDSIVYLEEFKFLLPNKDKP